MEIYKNCSTLSIYAFCMIIKTNDLRFLIKDFKEEDEKSYKSEKNNPELVSAFNSILNEHRALTKDREALTRIKSSIDIEGLEFDYYLAVKVLNIYKDTKEAKVLDLLEGIVPYDNTKPIGPQLDVAEKKLIGLSNKIKIKKSNFEKRYNSKDKLEQEEEQLERIISDLDKSALSLEISLSLGYRIDIKNTSVSRWINLMEASKSKQKAHENGKS